MWPAAPAQMRPGRDGRPAARDPGERDGEEGVELECRLAHTSQAGRRRTRGPRLPAVAPGRQPRPLGAQFLGAGVWVHLWLDVVDHLQKLLHHLARREKVVRSVRLRPIQILTEPNQYNQAKPI